jgi:hypothetical protein
VDINVNNYNNFNKANISSGKWEHNVEHRKGVQYRDAASQLRYNRRTLTGKASDVKAMLDVLGPAARPLITSGDPVADRHDRERMVQEYEEPHSLVMSGETKVVLQVGNDDWPFPIPLVKDETGWRFDTQVGKEEIFNWRIGRNELAAIEVCRAYVDAQRGYYLRNPQGDALLQYAQQFASTEGSRDGLYWAAEPGEGASPLGPLIANARGEG